MPYQAATSLWNGIWLMEQVRERDEWLERDGSQGTHTGRVTVGREGMF